MPCGATAKRFLQICSTGLWKRILSDAEINIILEESKGGQLYPFFVVALGTGMRMGEILGLTWECIDMENGTILVDKTLCYLPEGGKAIYEFHQPKTKAGKRIIRRKTNNPINEAYIRGAVRYLIKKINRKYPDLNFEPFTSHGLRHSFATKAIEKGMRPKTLQKILGHNSLQMTMDLYCHVEEHTLKEEMVLIGKVV